MKTLYFIITIMAFSCSVWSKTYHVDQSGTSDFTTITAALKVCQDGDEVIVHPGIYYESVVIKSNIYLHSQNPLDA